MQQLHASVNIRLRDTLYHDLQLKKKLHSISMWLLFFSEGGWGGRVGAKCSSLLVIYKYTKKILTIVFGKRC